MTITRRTLKILHLGQDCFGGDKALSVYENCLDSFSSRLLQHNYDEPCNKHNYAGFYAAINKQWVEGRGMRQRFLFKVYDILQECRGLKGSEVVMEVLANENCHHCHPSWRATNF